MSLHAHLTPEAEERLKAQKRNSVITSIIIGVLTVLLVGLILITFALRSLNVDSRPIVTYNAGMDNKDNLEQKQINNEVKRNPSAPSSSMAKVIASTTPSPTAVPVPEVDVPDPSENFGSGDDFGAGWGTGGDGGGGGFGSIPATMRKRCSLEDRLQRLEANGGNEKCEESVMKALRWFKTNQNGDGSFGGGQNVAMTGLVLLAFLGHCETPLSAEFGECVSNAIVYLVDNNRKQKGRMASNLGDKHWCYEHGIAAYALAEAYTFCKQLGIPMPNLQESVQDGIQWIIDNQNKSGGWEYGYDEGGRGGDMSITAWQMQALKAGKHTGLEFRNMRRCISKALSYCKDCQDSNGGFGYAGKKPLGNHYTLTGAGSLIFQQHKGASNSNARSGVRYIEKEGKFDYQNGPCNLYEHYYVSQAMINNGGKPWAKYNEMFRDELLNKQNGDGSFPKPPGGSPGARGDAVYNTALATLMLEVYYRFLPGTGKL